MSLARFIIDDIVYADGTCKRGVWGGGGLHACFGMRYWWPPPRAADIGFVLQLGDDDDGRQTLQTLPSALDVTYQVILHPQTRTSRALNTFTAADGSSSGGADNVEHRDFRLLVPQDEYERCRTHVAQVEPHMLSALRAVHLLTNAAKCVDMVNELLAACKDLEWVVWEPTPHTDTLTNVFQEQRDGWRTACAVVDVVTPNHEEALGILLTLPRITDHEQPTAVSQLRSDVEAFAMRFLAPADLSEAMALSTTAQATGATTTTVNARERLANTIARQLTTQADLVHLARLFHRCCTLPWPATYDMPRARSSRPATVLRCAQYGCVIVIGADHQQVHLVPAFHPAESSRVVDPTGAGNAFAGGMCVGLCETAGDVVQSAVYGAVSASLTLEQVGMASRTMAKDGDERWNGERVRDRLKLVMSRSVESGQLLPQQTRNVANLS
ncbi:hypothetical protein RI367_006649 [Sorochytrium milnesiophthora]